MLVVGAAALVNGTTGRAAELLAVVGIGVVALMFMVASQGLYRSRVCAVRAVETARLGRAAAIAAALALIVATALGLPFGWGQAIGAMVVTWVLLSTARGLYAAWLSRARSQGRFCRPVVVIGTGDEGYELFKLVDLHPELGLRVAGVIGPRHSLARWDGEVEWLGEIADAAPGRPDGRGERRDRGGQRPPRPRPQRPHPRAARRPGSTSSSRAGCAASTSAASARCRSRTSRSSTSSPPRSRAGSSA